MTVDLQKLQDDVNDLMEWRQSVWDNFKEKPSEVDTNASLVSDEELASELDKSERKPSADTDKREFLKQKVRKIIVEFKQNKNPTNDETAEYKHRLHVLKYMLEVYDEKIAF